ncbi:MAG: hypothetical protein HC769_04765 [Cyanobacteria bacterium CRU_2_1]|nr:hypothetical protein [Cyanobacteria bacterium RU_5_0]NJR58222.1 hypothetical protein [Cyanobacteria bacterium CRU_2_1]
MCASIGFTTNFQPGHIVYLEYQETRLYAEVIQVVTERQLCWVRPLALFTRPNELYASSSSSLPPEQLGLEEPTLYDLRQGADLLYPQSLFRVALDTEVLPLIAQLNTLKTEQENIGEPGQKDNFHAHHQLQEFIYRIWQAQPEAFQS